MSGYSGTTVSLLSLFGDDDMRWAADGECRRVGLDGAPVYDAEIWHPVGTTGPALVQANYAKSICRRCPVVVSCAAWAVERLEWGIAGGLDEEQRREIRRERARTAVSA